MSLIFVILFINLLIFFVLIFWVWYAMMYTVQNQRGWNRLEYPNSDGGRLKVRRVEIANDCGLEETPAERAKYTEEQAERLFSYLIYKEAKRYAN